MRSELSRECVDSGDQLPKPPTPIQSSPRCRHCSASSGVGAALADLLGFGEAADLVARRELRRDARADDLPAGRRPLGDALIHYVVPACGVAGIGVGKAAGDVRVVTEGPRGAVEPHLVLHDRPAHCEAGVPAADDGGRVRDAERFQLVVDVVALRPFTGDVAEVGAVERVAAGLGDEVERRAAAIGLAETARHGDLHFLGTAGVVAVAGDAAAVERRADVHAVDLHGAFVAAAAAGGKEDHVGGDAAVLDAVGLDARLRGQEVPVAAGRRQRGHDLVVEDALDASGVLHVDDRRLADHRNRLLQATDAHLGVERHGDAGLEFHAGALDGREAGERVSDGVQARDQVLETELAGAVADGRADLFDQGRARRLDRDAGQDGARRIADHARNRLGLNQAG